MRVQRRPAAALLALVALGAAGCSDNGNELAVRPPSTHPTAPVTSSTSPSPTAPASPAKPTVSVDPATGLHDGQTVQVSIDGFSPAQTLIVAECVDKGDATGQGDCNLEGIVPVTVDGQGHAETPFTVTTGPFGANKGSCTPTQHCLISVSQATPNPTEQADADIAFA